jgi:hypothetical protein
MTGAEGRGTRAVAAKQPGPPVARGRRPCTESAQERWRRFNGHELVADVLNDVKFTDGIKVTEDDTKTQDERVAA